MTVPNEAKPGLARAVVIGNGAGIRSEVTGSFLTSGVKCAAPGRGLKGNRASLQA